MYEYKKVTNLGKLYLLPKIHKRLYNVPGRPVISNCGTPTGKVSEFLDHHLKPIMQEGWSYIKDTKAFLKKIENIGKIPQDSIFVTFDVVGLYPSIPYNAGLNALKDALDCRQNKKIPTGMLVKWQNLFSPIITLSLGKKYSIKFLETLLTRNLHHHIPAFLWISLRQTFLKRRNCSPLFGLSVKMMYSLYGLMVKRNFKIL